MTRRIAALAVLVTAVLVPAAHAATPAGAVFGLRAVGNPKLGYFVYPVAPGKSVKGAVIVSNTGTKTGSVRIYAADGGTGATTGTVYLTDAHPFRAGSWIQLATARLTLAPGRFKRVPFTVHVPADAKPGEWVGGVVAESTTAARSTRTKQKAGVQIKIRNQTIIAVQVNVPGARRAAFSVGAVKTGGQRGYQQLIVHLANTGNVLRKPTGKVEVLKSGHLVETLPFVMDTFLPQTSIDYPILLKKALAPGDYQARVSLSFPSAGGASKRLSTTKAFTISKTDVQQVFTSAAPSQQPVTGGSTTSSSGSSTSAPWGWIVGGVVAGILLLLLAFQLRRRGGEADYVPTVVMPLPSPVAPPARITEPAPNGEAAAPPGVAPPAPEAAPPPAWTQPAQPETAPAGGPLHRDHLWEVAYDRGELGRDGVWRFPHNCRECGVEVVASDTADAALKANALQPAGR
jgi:hypothetical protein